VVVSNIFYVHPYLGKYSNLTNIFQIGWNHQLVIRWSLSRKTPRQNTANRTTPDLLRWWRSRRFLLAKAGVFVLTMFSIFLPRRKNKEKTHITNHSVWWNVIRLTKSTERTVSQLELCNGCLICSWEFGILGGGFKFQDFQFDSYFSLGWFNHQLDILISLNKHGANLGYLRIYL